MRSTFDMNGTEIEISSNTSFCEIKQYKFLVPELFLVILRQKLSIGGYDRSSSHGSNLSNAIRQDQQQTDETRQTTPERNV